VANIVTDLGPADLVRRSASSVLMPQRQLPPIAKLIDVSNSRARHNREPRY
jgi:hypothetical protein